VITLLRQGVFSGTADEIVIPIAMTSSLSLSSSTSIHIYLYLGFTLGSPPTQAVITLLSQGVFAGTARSDGAGLNLLRNAARRLGRWCEAISSAVEEDHAAPTPGDSSFLILLTRTAETCPFECFVFCIGIHLELRPR